MELLNQMKQQRKPNFTETKPLSLHSGIEKQFKFTSTNKFAYNTSDAMSSMRDTLYNLIKENRNDATQKISIAVKEKLAKNMGNNNRQDTYSNTSNNVQIIDKYHYTQPKTLYPKSSIRKLLDNLEEEIVYNRFNNMASNEGSSNQRSLHIDNIYIKFRKIDPPGVRSFIETPVDLKNKNATINHKNDDNMCLLISIARSIFYDHLNSKNPGRITKKLLNYCKLFNIDNINFHPNGRDTDQFEKNNPDIAVTIFEYNGFRMINKEDDNYGIDTMMGILIVA